MSWLTDRIHAVTEPIVSALPAPIQNLSAQLATVDSARRDALAQIDPTNLTAQEAKALVTAGARAFAGDYAGAVATVQQGYAQSRQIAAGKQATQNAAQMQQIANDSTSQIETNRANALQISAPPSVGISPALLIGGAVLLFFIIKH